MRDPELSEEMEQWLAENHAARNRELQEIQDEMTSQLLHEEWPDA